MKFKFGTQVFASYFLVFYLIPALISYVVGFHSNFVPPKLTLHSVLLFSVFLGVWFFIYNGFTLVTNNLSLKVPNIFRAQRIWLAISIFSVALGMYFFVNFGLEYRQTGDRLSDSGILVKIVYLIKPLVFGFALYAFFNKEQGKNSLDYERLILAFFLVFWGLTVTSSFEFLLLGLLLVYLISKSIFHKIFYAGLSLKNYSDIRNFILVIVIAPLLVFGIIFIGIANKTGIDDALPYIFEGDGLSRTAYYMYYRLSLFYHAFLYFSERHLLDWELYEKSYLILRDSLSYRFSLIFGFDATRPELTNLNRLVYQMIFYTPKDKEIGASPGYITSFMLIMPAYIGIALAGVYTAILHLILNKAGLRIIRFSPVAIFLVIYFLFPFLHNPINSFFSIGPEVYKAVFYLYVLLVLCKSSSNTGRKYG